MSRAASILMLDNYDSFTFNLVQYLEGAGATVDVVRNDAATVDELLARKPDGIVISPGPGRPENAGVCVELLQRRAPVTLLGVCLGHQALGHAFGADVVAAPRLMHGKTSPVKHTEAELLRELPNPFEATRYHSLTVDEASLPDELEAIAWSEDDGTLMAMRHRELPYWGVQFHPESILTRVGIPLIERFLGLCGSTS